ncbi:phosphatidylglycerophosphatase B [Arthrobacter saudimassiliensis]|uniref:Phosphatidylglycerophosphatase B n=1 Tax=Arthrobacter saudimassiliensis TaxID=1461584 RepID=A0A078MP51_9MICC|nr:phosphatidylglycerophosphatase B [Arthrobacter saudimassiliensis]
MPPVPASLRSLSASFAAWLRAHAGLLLILALGLVPALVLTAASAELYDAVTEEDGVAALDRPVLDAALGLRSPGLDAAVTGFTNIGGTVGMPLLAGAAAVLMVWRFRSWTPLLLLAVAAAGSLLMTVTGKALVGRPRPDRMLAVPPYEVSASFPSGHSLNSMVLAGVFAYLVLLYSRSRAVRIVAVAGAALFVVGMGLSRVYLGHHWLTDVLVAWTLGAAWVAVIITAHQLFLRRRRRPAVQGPGVP